jgi:hypothetical protein
MISETETQVVVLQLDDELLARLRPFLKGLDITITPHREWVYQALSEQGQFVGYSQVEQRKRRLTMRREVYDRLIEQLNGALDYDVRWQPNEYEPDGFVERVCPLEVTNGNHNQAPCPTCGVRLLANRAEVRCACGQQVVLR